MENDQSLSKRIINWVQNLDHELRIILLAGIVGVIGGFGAIIFRIAIRNIYYLFQTLPKSFTPQYAIIVTILSPAIGGLIVGYIIANYANEEKGSGIPQLIGSVNLKGGFIHRKVPIAKIIASSFTIGSGGSAGREGPIAQIGGGMGSIIGTYLGLRSEERKVLVLSGVSAGVAATFNAPLGGVLFGLEVIRRDRRTFNILPLIVSSVVATSISEVVLGRNPSFIFPTNLSYQNATNIPFFVIIGIIVGLFSILWIKGFYLIEGKIEQIPISPVILPAIGGLFVGIIEVFYPQVTGVNYEAINQAFTLQLSMGLIIMLLLMKFIATILTLTTGGSGGIFAPTLFLGVMIGLILGTISHQLGFTSLPIPIFGLLGMAALFAASSRAPLTAIIMTAEMVNDFQLFIPLMFSVAIAWLISREITEDDIYIVKFRKQGINFEHTFDALDDIKVDEIMTKDIITISAKDRLEEVIRLMKQTGHTGYPVIDEKNNLVGIITEHDIDIALDSRELSDWIVSEIMTKEVITVVDNCPVSNALLILEKYQVNRFPVVDHSNRKVLVGWITRSDLLRAYRICKKESRVQSEEERLFEQVHSGELHL